MAQEAVIAAEATETEADESREGAGSSPENRSLTSQTGQADEFEGLSNLEKAVRVQEAYEKKLAGKAPDKQQPEAKAEGEPEAEKAEEPAAEAEGEAENEAEDEAEGEEIEPAKGSRVPVRRTRLEKLLDKSHKYDELVEALSKRSLDQNQTKAPEQGQKQPPQIAQATFKDIEDRITAARTKLKQAKTDFDTDAEIAASEDLADAKAELKLAQVREVDAKARDEQGWKQTFDYAEREHFAEREKLWNEDVARLQALDDDSLDLDDKESPFYRAVAHQVRTWFNEKNPIVNRANVYRRAVEVVSDAFGVDLPSVKQAAVPPVKSKTVQQRNQAVIGKTVGGNTGNTAGLSGTHEDVMAQIQTMDPFKRLELLSQVIDNREKRKS